MAAPNKKLAESLGLRVSWLFADLGVALGVSRKLRSTPGISRLMISLAARRLVAQTA